MHFAAVWAGYCVAKFWFARQFVIAETCVWNIHFIYPLYRGSFGEHQVNVCPSRQDQAGRSLSTFEQ